MNGASMPSTLLVLLLLCTACLASSWLNPFPQILATKTRVDDANCTVEDVNNANQLIFPIVSRLVNTTFFKIFKVDLTSECPFWAMQVLCGVEGGCSVCKCDEKDIPIPWKVTKKNHVNTFLTKNTKKWIDDDKDSWFPKRDEDYMTYVNLVLNPETNTGYSGTEANRVWKAIYTENCFKAGKLNDMCLEERVFFRLISGLHTSITVKIATYYHKRIPIPQDPSLNQHSPAQKEDTSAVVVSSTQSPNSFNTYEMFSPNLDFFEHRIAPFEDRLKNLYFLYTFTLRAVQKASDYLLQYNYETGNKEEQTQIELLMKQLVLQKVSQLQCPTFDESVLFNQHHQDNQFIQSQMKNHFRNISMIMDCVACEKCRMWAKLEMLGLATAFKIVLAEDLKHEFKTIQRNEIIALINSLKQLSQSIEDVKRLHSMVFRRKVAPYISIVVVSGIGLVILRFLFALVKRSTADNEKEKKKSE